MEPQKTPQSPASSEEEKQVVTSEEPHQDVNVPSDESNEPAEQDLSGLETEKPVAPEEPRDESAPSAGEPLPPSSDTEAEPMTPETDASIGTEPTTASVADQTTAPAEAKADEPSLGQTPGVITPSTGPADEAPESAETPTIVPPVVPVQNAKPKRKKWVLALIILIVVLILGAGAAAAYVGFIMPNQPKYVLARAFGNTTTESKLSSANFSGTFRIKDNENLQTFTGSIAGRFNQKQFIANSTFDAGVTKITLDIASPAKDQLYVRVGGLEGVPELLSGMGGEAAAYAPLVNSFNNQWFEINQSLLSAAHLDEAISGQYSLSDADAKKIEAAYRKHMFLEVSQTYKDEDINGLMSHHYQAKINDTELEAFLKEVKAANIKGQEITDAQIKQIKDAHPSKYPMDVWVAKDKKIITKFAFDTKEGQTAAHLEISLSQVNKPVSVSKPDNTKTFLQILGASDAGKQLSQMLSQKTDGLDGQSQLN